MVMGNDFLLYYRQVFAYCKRKQEEPLVTEWSENIGFIEQVSTRGPNFAVAHLSPWSATCWGCHPKPAYDRCSRTGPGAGAPYNIIDLDTARSLHFCRFSGLCPFQIALLPDL